MVLYFAYSPGFLKTKMRTKCHLDLWMLSPCDFRQGHVYTHTHIVILCLRGKRDFSTRFVWAERTLTIPRVLFHIERYGCVWYICFGICKQVNNDEIIENKIHFSRWGSVYLPKKTLKCSNFINIFIFIFWTHSQQKIMWTSFLLV